MHRSMIAAAILLAVPPQDESEKLWKFTKGTKWTYVGAAGSIVHTVTDVLKDEVRFEIKTLDTMDAEIGKKTAGAFQMRKGQLLRAKVAKGKVEVEVALWKPGAKEGETWDVETGAGKITTKFLGLQDVTVPAGTYAQAIAVEYSIGDAKTTVHLASGIGIVQMKIKAKDKADELWTLKEFKAGK